MVDRRIKRGRIRQVCVDTTAYSVLGPLPSTGCGSFCLSYSPSVRCWKARTFFSRINKSATIKVADEIEIRTLPDRLLIFRGLPHDPQSILAAVYEFALVGFVLGCNVGSRVMLARFELGVAAFAHADNRGRGFFDDPQSSVRHDVSLAHLTGRRNVCGNQTAPLPKRLAYC